MSPDCQVLFPIFHENQFLNNGLNSTLQAAAVTGRQRSESAGRFGQVFQKIRKLISVPIF